MELNDIKQGYLDLVRAELSYYGVDESKVTFNNQLEIEGHIIDFGIFKSHTECLFDFPIKVYLLDDEKSIMFMPANRIDYEKYRNDPELENSLDEIVKKAQDRLDYLYSEYISEISEFTSGLTLSERIPEKMKENLQITESLSDIKEKSGNLKSLLEIVSADQVKIN